MIRKRNFKLNWKYALGELVLIFLGISLAITFQNWNEDRKNKAKELKFLEGLYADFQADSTKLVLFSNLTKMKEVDAQSVKRYLKDPKLPLEDSTQFVLNVFFNGRYIQYEPFLPTYDELIASGQVNIISNDNIKNDIRGFLSYTKVNQSFLFSEAALKKQEYNAHISTYFNAEIMTFLWRQDNRESRKFKEIENFGIDINGFRNDPESLIRVQNAAAVDGEASDQYIRLLNNVTDFMEAIALETEKIK
jgi:Family of unknown function (DUF6090)